MWMGHNSKQFLNIYQSYCLFLAVCCGNYCVFKVFIVVVVNNEDCICCRMCIIYVFMCSFSNDKNSTKEVKQACRIFLRRQEQLVSS